MKISKLPHRALVPLHDSPGRRRSQLGRVRHWLLGVVILAAAGAFGWWKYHAQETAAGAPTDQSGPPRNGPARMGGNMPQAVSMAEARLVDLRVSVSAIGNLVASNTAIVRAQVSGTLQALHFSEGQQVKAGQALADIDPRAFQAAVGQAEGNLARDSAQLDNARLDLMRYRDLLAKDAIAKQQLDTQEALVHQLEGTTKADKSALESARLQLAYTQVIAPISGRVGLKQADLGNVVQPGDANGIVSIAQTRPIAMVFAVPAANLPLIVKRLHARQSLAVEAIDRGDGHTLATGQVASQSAKTIPAAKPETARRRSRSGGQKA